MLKRVRSRDVLMGRLQRGDDLLDALTAVVQPEGAELHRGPDEATGLPLWRE